MRYHVHWRLLFRVKDLRKARKRIEKVQEAFGLEIKIVLCERYWKIPALWDCSLDTPQVDNEPANATFDCLRLAQGLGNGWYLLGPMVKDGVLVVFSGIFDARHGTAYIAGLDWGSFDIISERSETATSLEPDVD